MYIGLEWQEIMSITDARSWAAGELGSIAVRDQRVVDRLIWTLAKSAEHPGRTIPQACGGSAETKAAYRLMDNDSFSSESVLAAHRERTIERMPSHDIVLSIQDTSHVVYDSPPNGGGIGLCSSSEYRKGALMHTALAVTTEGIPLGLLDQQIWTRAPEETRKNRSQTKRSIEDKEGVKWLECLDRSLEAIPSRVTVVTVCDREADVYEFIRKALLEEKPILIRAVYNRRVIEEHRALFALVESSPEAGKILIGILRDAHKCLPPRQAMLAVKFLQATLWPTLGKAKMMVEKPVYVVQAKEIDPPERAEAVDWLLLTTLPVTSFEDAVEKINWYSRRWRIERFHYVLKSGCGIEELQFQTLDRLKKAIALYSLVAWGILWLNYQARETPEASCAVILEKHEWHALYCIANNTPILPETPPTLEEAVRLIGKLGGHLGRKHDGMPGVKTLRRGMQRLKDILQALSIICQVPLLSMDMGNV